MQPHSPHFCIVRHVFVMRDFVVRPVSVTVRTVLWPISAPSARGRASDRFSLFLALIRNVSVSVTCSDSFMAYFGQFPFLTHDLRPVTVLDGFLT